MLWLVLVILVFLAESSQSIQVEKGIFSHLTIKIDEFVTQPSSCDAFLEDIEELLNDSWRGFFELTRRQGRIKSVDIVLPKSWNLEKCYTKREVDFKRIPTRDKIDIFIGLANSHFGNSPWVDQFGHCGQRSLALHVPSTFFNNLRGNLQRKSNMFLKAFCKYQFGVFDEDGFLYDNLYPAAYVDGNSTVSNHGCKNSPKQIFCPLGSVYDRYAPTKQNLLCMGDSVLETIMNHQDLKSPKSAWNEVNDVNHLYRQFSQSIRPERQFEAPTYNIIYPQKSRYILVLERSKAMSLHDRWDILHKAINEFITMLPVGSELSIVTFSKNAIMHLPPTLVTETNKLGLYGRLPKRTTYDEKVCLYCAFNMTFKALQDFEGQIQPASVIFVSGAGSRPENYEILLKLFESAQIHVFTISYPSTSFPQIVDLSRSNGKHFSVQDSASTLYTMTTLSQVFADILGSIEHETYSNIHFEFYNQLNIRGTFTLEDSMESDMYVTLVIDNTDSVEMFELESPSGHTRIFPLFMNGFIQFHLKLDSFSSDGKGVWSYRVKCYEDLKEIPRSIVKVTALDSGKDRISITSFSGHVRYDHPDQPPKIYTKLSLGQKPILRANVLAIITSPDGKMPTKLQLEDNGNGLVDVTQNDGIYSAIFPYVGALTGFYSVQIIVDDNEGQAVLPNDGSALASSADTAATNGAKCCGSKIEFKRTQPCPKFRRFASGSSFYVNYTLSKDIDMIPPSRIIDLKRVLTPTFMTVTPSFDNGQFFTLEWSAPGNDYVYGKAYQYKIQCFQGKNSKEIDINQEDLPLPEVYGTKQSVVLRIPEKNTAYFYTIFAIDEAANAGKISNVVSIFAYKPYYIESTTTTTSTPIATTPASFLAGNSNDLGKRLRNRPTLRSIFSPNYDPAGSVIISPNPANSMIDITNSIDMPENEDVVKYNEISSNQLTVTSNIPANTRSRSKDRYTEEAKIQIYTITGVVSMMLLVILIAASVFVMKKRKQRHSEILKDNYKENPLAISTPTDPWTTNDKLKIAYPNMVRSNVWFDSLHRSIQRHRESFVNPMISNSFPTVDEENENEIRDDNQDNNNEPAINENGTLKKRHNSLDSCIGEAHFHSIKADPNCVTEESSLDDLDELNSQTGINAVVNTPKTVPSSSTDLPDYENFSSIRKLKKSKSFNAHLEKPPRTYRTVTYLDGDVDMRTPSIRNKSSGNPSPTAPASINPTRSSLRNTVQRSKTFSSTKERKYHQQPLKHTNSRISEIIRQYNQANEMLAKPGKGGSLFQSEALITPPPFPVDFAGKDEDWELQKSLGTKQHDEIPDVHHGPNTSKLQASLRQLDARLLEFGHSKRGARPTSDKTRPNLSFLQNENEKQKDSTDMVFSLDTKTKAEIKYKGYDFPKEPPKPTVPPRAPRGTLSKGTMNNRNGTLTHKKGQAPKAPPYLQFNFQNDLLK